MHHQTPELPVIRPRLPRAEALLPYLRRMDETRRYSDDGPLHREFQVRLGAQFGLGPDNIALTANGTLGLTLALQGQRPERGSLCLMPSWTCAATAHAVFQAGLKPYFVDVDPATWSLVPTQVLLQAAGAPGPVGAVVVVSPFGAPLDLHAWQRFRETSGLAVAVDAAAGFDSLQPCALPAVVSLHANKIFGIGQGGLVVSTDRELIAEIDCRTRFGFRGERWAPAEATDARLSEYAAAVGLAGLDVWPQARARWLALRRLYEQSLAGVPGIALSPGTSGVATSTLVVQTRDEVEPLEASLALRGIGSQRWWGWGCHAQPAFARCPRAPLPATEDLAEHSLGLPFHLDMGEAEVARVIAALRAAAPRVAA